MDSLRRFCAGFAAAAGILTLVAVLPVSAATVYPRPTAVAAVRAATTNNSPCARGPMTQGCPLTPRLRQRLQHLQVNANLLCRCQNTHTGAAYRQLSNNGRTARVLATLSFGTNPLRLTFVAVRVSGGWLVDDNYCTGRPATDLYRSKGGPCS